MNKITFENNNRTWVIGDNYIILHVDGEKVVERNFNALSNSEFLDVAILASDLERNFIKTFLEIDRIVKVGEFMVDAKNIGGKCEQDE